MSYLACHSHCAVNGVMVYGIPYIAKFVCVLYGNIGEAYCQNGTFEEVIVIKYSRTAAIFVLSCRSVRHDG